MTAVELRVRRISFPRHQSIGVESPKQSFPVLPNAVNRQQSRIAASVVPHSTFKVRPSVHREAVMSMRTVVGLKFAQIGSARFDEVISGRALPRRLYLRTNVVISEALMIVNTT